MEDITILVNKENPISKDYKPSNLVSVPNPYFNPFFPESRLEMVNYVWESFQMLANAAKEAGFELYADSAYRSSAYQQKILDYYVSKMGEKAYSTVALPGTSEHQLGLAIDVACFENGEYKEELTEEMPATKWLHQNCANFGFILRYPKGKEEITGYSFEPWHIRFVGLELAQELTEKGLTLEEYKRTQKR